MLMKAPSRSVRTWFVLAATLSLTVIAPMVTAAAAAPKPSIAGSSFTVRLKNTQVAVDNLSDYSNSRITTLVQWADRGMATTNPLKNNVAGEMQNGDRVIATHYGIYWLDIKRRGGLLSGIWALVPSGNGADFQYTANSNQWSPNELLPGSDGHNTAIYDTGQGLSVLATGAADGSCTQGKGTFVINNSANCGIPNNGVSVSLSTTVISYDHVYTFSGTLYQEGTARNTIMTDSFGNSATINFTLTYHFRDYTDSNYDYGPSNGPETQRVRTEIVLTPSSAIHLGTLVVPGNSDKGAIPYPFRKVNYSNTYRQAFGCNGGTFQPGMTGVLCEGAPNSSNWITQPNSLPATVAQGDFVTEQQSSQPGDAAGRQMTYMLPNSSAYRLPERIDQIWNSRLAVSSLDVDYFNVEDVLVATGGSVNLGFDIQMVPHP